MLLPIQIGYRPVDTLRNLLLHDRIDAERFINATRNFAVKQTFQAVNELIMSKIMRIDIRDDDARLTDDQREHLAAADLAEARAAFNVANIDRISREHHAKDFKITQSTRDNHFRTSYLLNPDSVYQKIKETVTDDNLWRVQIELIAPKKAYEKIYDITVDEHFLANALTKWPDRYLRTALDTADHRMLLTYVRTPPKNARVNARTGRITQRG